LGCVGWEGSENNKMRNKRQHWIEDDVNSLLSRKFLLALMLVSLIFILLVIIVADVYSVEDNMSEPPQPHMSPFPSGGMFNMFALVMAVAFGLVLLCGFLLWLWWSRRRGKRGSRNVDDPFRFVIFVSLLELCRRLSMVLERIVR
jgi:hypothetical protein